MMRVVTFRFCFKQTSLPLCCCLFPYRGNVNLAPKMMRTSYRNSSQINKLEFKLKLTSTDELCPVSL